MLLSSNAGTAQRTCTVMTPSLPTRSIARAISFPISSSPFAEMVPTFGRMVSQVKT